MTDLTKAYDSALELANLDSPRMEEAYGLLREASRVGDDRATYALATWYLSGNEILQKDEKEGVRLLKILENSLVAEALFDLAVAYDYGNCVEKDEAKAFSLYMRAGLLGDAQSCEQISQFYNEGEFVSHDKCLCDAWKLRSEQNEKDISPPYRMWLK